MKRKLFLTVVVGSIMLGFVGCGANSTEQATSATANNESVQNDIVIEELTEITTKEEISDPVYVKSVEIVDRSTERESLPSLSFDEYFGYDDYIGRKDEKAQFRDYIDSVINNNTDKTITGVVVCYAFWDKNGQPIKCFDNYIDEIHSFDNQKFYCTYGLGKFSDRLYLKDFQEINSDIKQLYKQVECNSLQDLREHTRQIYSNNYDYFSEVWKNTGAEHEYKKLDNVFNEALEKLYELSGINREKSAFIQCDFIGLEKSDSEEIYCSNDIYVLPKDSYQFEIMAENRSIPYKNRKYYPVTIPLDEKTPIECRAIVSEYFDSDGNLYTNPELKDWCIKYAGNVLDEMERK